jgi:hypothetical protein
MTQRSTRQLRHMHQRTQLYLQLLRDACALSPPHCSINFIRSLLIAGISRMAYVEEWLMWKALLRSRFSDYLLH